MAERLSLGIHSPTNVPPPYISAACSPGPPATTSWMIKAHWSMIAWRTWIQMEIVPLKEKDIFYIGGTTPGTRNKHRYGHTILED